MAEIKDKHPSVQDTPSYDFDVLREKSFIYHWVKVYMDATYKTIQRSGCDLRGVTLYDIGIGRGRSLAVFKALGVEKIVGIDINAKEVEYALKQKDRLHCDLEIIIDNREGYYLKSVPSDSCTIVSIMNTLNFLTKEVREATLTEAKRILIPGGYLIITDATKPSLMWFFNSLARMPRIFSTSRELKQSLYPLRLLESSGSNFLYFINKPMDQLGKVFGQDIYRKMNRLLQTLNVPPSTKTFVFRKS